MDVPPVAACVVRLRTFAARHVLALWWTHSAYALALGIGVMWLGARDFLWLRVAAFYVAFLWVSSTVVARVFDDETHATPWSRRGRAVVNYINRNAYQQVLFFILPVYYGSTTWFAPNSAFVVLLAVSAVLSTMDLVYDRFLTANRWRAAGFFAFNAFATVNVALPVLFGVANHVALRIAAVAAALGFATIAIRPDRLQHRRMLGMVLAGTFVVFLAAEAGRALVPPAPLRVVGSTFGTRFDEHTIRILPPTVTAVPRQGVRLFAVTAIDAPAGLSDRLVLRWSQGGTTLWQSPPYDIRGGRSAGFRLWSSVALASVAPDAPVTLSVVTEAGQLVGRVTLPPSAASRS